MGSIAIQFLKIYSLGFYRAIFDTLKKSPKDSVTTAIATLAFLVIISKMGIIIKFILPAGFLSAHFSNRLFRRSARLNAEDLYPAITRAGFNSYVAALLIIAGVSEAVLLCLVMPNQSLTISQVILRFTIWYCATVLAISLVLWIRVVRNAFPKMTVGFSGILLAFAVVYYACFQFPHQFMGRFLRAVESCSKFYFSAGDSAILITCLFLVGLAVFLFEMYRRLLPWLRLHL
jgi:hypothetical protein